MIFALPLFVATALLPLTQATITNLGEACSILGTTDGIELCLITKDFKKPSLLIVDESRQKVGRRLSLISLSGARSTFDQADRFTRELGLADHMIPSSDRREIERDLSKHHLKWAPFDKSYAGSKSKGVFVFVDGASAHFIESGLAVIAYEENPAACERASKGFADQAAAYEYLCYVPTGSSDVCCLAKIMRVYGDLQYETDAGSIYLWPDQKALSFVVGDKLYSISVAAIPEVR